MIPKAAASVAIEAKTTPDQTLCGASARKPSGDPGFRVAHRAANVQAENPANKIVGVRKCWKAIIDRENRSTKARYSPVNPANPAIIPIPNMRDLGKLARNPASRPSNPKATEVRSGAKNQKEGGKGKVCETQATGFDQSENDSGACSEQADPANNCLSIVGDGCHFLSPADLKLFLTLSFGRHVNVLNRDAKPLQEIPFPTNYLTLRRLQ